jgi:osmotically-inducible protein OsmY
MPWQTEEGVNVVERAQTVLLRNPYLALKNVRCEYDGGVLTLRGCLPSYYLKQVAQTAVGDVEGVRQVLNYIQVVSPARREEP